MAFEQWGSIVAKERGKWGEKIIIGEDGREKKLARVIFLIIYLKVGFWRRGGAFKVTEEPVRGSRYANESGVFPGKKAI